RPRRLRRTLSAAWIKTPLRLPALRTRRATHAATRRDCYAIRRSATRSPRRERATRRSLRPLADEVECGRAAADHAVRVAADALAQFAIGGHDPKRRRELAHFAGNAVVRAFLSFPDDEHVMTVRFGPLFAEGLEFVLGDVRPQRSPDILRIDENGRQLRVTAHAEVRDDHGTGSDGEHPGDSCEPESSVRGMNSTELRHRESRPGS